MVLMEWLRGGAGSEGVSVAAGAGDSVTELRFFACMRPRARAVKARRRAKKFFSTPSAGLAHMRNLSDLNLPSGR